MNEEDALSNSTPLAELLADGAGGVELITKAFEWTGSGRVGTLQTPLFPRIETEVATA